MVHEIQRAISCNTLRRGTQLLQTQCSGSSLEDPVDVDAMIEATCLKSLVTIVSLVILLGFSESSRTIFPLYSPQLQATKLQIAGAQRRLLAASAQHRSAEALKDDTVLEPGSPK